MIELSDYGDILRKYSGNGILQQPELEPLGCPFEVAQFTNGNIVLICSFTGPIRINESGTIALTGTTDLGQPLVIEGPGINIRSNHSMGSSQYVFSFHGNTKLSIGKPEWDGAVEIRFGLTNFKFMSTEIEEIAPNSKSLNSLRVELEGREVTIRQLDDYKERVEALRALRRIDVTCEARIKTKKAADIESVQTLVSNLCGLLTLARGTLVSWLYFDIVSAAGKTVYSEYREAITRNYIALPLIDHMPPVDTKYFIEKCYPRYLELDPVYQLNRVIHAYVDVRASGFLETRGLALGTLVEYLAFTFAQIEKRQVIIDENIFEERKDQLQEKVREVVKEQFPELDDPSIDSMAAHAQGFNYRPFRNRLKRLLRHFRVSFTDDDLNGFINFRDKLVHYMDVVSEEKFLQMVHFLDKLLLYMLDYDSYYIDVTQFPLASGSRSAKLTPTS